MADQWRVDVYQTSTVQWGRNKRWWGASIYAPGAFSPLDFSLRFATKAQARKWAKARIAECKQWDANPGPDTFFVKV